MGCMRSSAFRASSALRPVVATMVSTVPSVIGVST